VDESVKVEFTQLGDGTTVTFGIPGHASHPPGPIKVMV
jgi:hypothetical protein